MSQYRRLHSSPPPIRPWETLLIGAGLIALAIAPVAVVVVGMATMPACPWVGG
jgi:hypothetical protein